MIRNAAGIFIFWLVFIILTCGGCAQEPGGGWVGTIESPQYFAVLVADVDVAVRWYRNALGLELEDDSEAEDGSWRIVNLKNDRLRVEIIRDGRAVARVRDHGFFKVGFQVPDVGPIADRVETAGGSRPRIVDDAKHALRILQLQDPEGNILQLFSPFRDR